MASSQSTVAEDVAAVQEGVQQAATRAGRKASDVTIVGIGEIVQDVGKFANQVVRVKGKIENKGNNLQVRTGRRIVLTDPEGKSIDVTSLPSTIEVAPKQGQEKSHPASLPEILNQNVEVIGKVEKTSDGEPVLAIPDITLQ